MRYAYYNRLSFLHLYSDNPADRGGWQPEAVCKQTDTKFKLIHNYLTWLLAVRCTFGSKPLIKNGNLQVYIYKLCAWWKRSSGPTSEHVKSHNSLGACPQPPYTICIAGPHFLHFICPGPSNPSGGPDHAYGEYQMPSLATSNGGQGRMAHLDRKIVNVEIHFDWFIF